MADIGNTPGRGTSRRRPHISPKLLIAIALGALAIWFIFINQNRTRITFWLADVRAPLWLVLLGTFLAGMTTMWLIGQRRK